MKVNYFGYYLNNSDDNKKVLCDLRAFLKAFCSYENTEFKNNFSYHNERLYLLRQSGDVFLFLVTRSKELIQKIDTKTFSVDEIKDLLADDERLGFASYILLKEHMFGIGCTHLSPRVGLFVNYINELFVGLGHQKWQMIPHAILSQTTKAEALKLAHVGRTTMEVSRENAFFEDICGSLGAETKDMEDLESIEIIMKPKPRKNIKPLVSKAMSHLPDEGVEKLLLKAKDEAASQMQELYIAGKGAVYDMVDKSRGGKIPELLESKVAKNEVLKRRLGEFAANEDYEKEIPEFILCYSDIAAWTDPVFSVPYSKTVDIGLDHELV